MKDIMNVIKNPKLIKFLSITLGLLLFVIFIWFRFLRTRLPKDIPMNLTLIKLVILIYIVIIYIYILYSMINISKKSSNVINEIIQILISPLETFDDFIKNFNIIKNNKEKIYSILLNSLNKLILEWNLYKYIFDIIPRLLLLTAFVIDVYYFHKLYYIYKIILIGLLILLGKYIIYTFKKYNNEKMEENKKHFRINMEYEYAIQIIEDTPPEDEEEEDLPPPTMMVPLIEFLNFQRNLYYEKKIQYPYIVGASRIGIETYRKKHSLETMASNDISKNNQEITDLVEKFLKSTHIIHYIENAAGADYKFKNLKILIFSNFLLGWLYILINSLSNLTVDYDYICESFKIYQNSIDPFSLLYLENFNYK